MRRALDVTGAALLLGALGWALTAGRAPGDRVGPLLLTYLAVGVAFAGGRAAAHRFGQSVAGAVVVVAVLLALVASGPLKLGSAGAAPFGYGNANGALYVQAAIAALFVATVLGRPGRNADRACSGQRRPIARAVALATAGLLSLVTVASGSFMAVLCLAVVGALLLAARRTGGTGLVAAGGACAVVLVIGFTAALALRAQPPRSPETLTLRAQLWRQAGELMVANPLDGVGAGRFADLTEVSSDPDLRWAHSGFLQQGAEQGSVGLALLLALIAWALLRCWRVADDTRAPAVGAAAITALALHASVDYVLHFGPLPMAAAFVAGAATLGWPPSTVESVTTPGVKRAA